MENERCILIILSAVAIVLLYPFLVMASTTRNNKQPYSSRGYLLSLGDQEDFYAAGGGVEIIIFGLMADQMYVLVSMRA